MTPAKTAGLVPAAALAAGMEHSPLLTLAGGLAGSMNAPTSDMELAAETNEKQAELSPGAAAVIGPWAALGSPEGHKMDDAATIYLNSLGYGLGGTGAGGLAGAGIGALAGRYSGNTAGGAQLGGLLGAQLGGVAGGMYGAHHGASKQVAARAAQAPTQKDSE